MEKILILDNYDSFTYNLVHLVREIGLGRPEVHRNDKIALEAVAEYDGIILSPGPGIPSESGILCDLIREYAPSKPIFRSAEHTSELQSLMRTSFAVFCLKNTPY